MFLNNNPSFVLWRASWSYRTAKCNQLGCVLKDFLNFGSIVTENIAAVSKPKNRICGWKNCHLQAIDTLFWVSHACYGSIGGATWHIRIDEWRKPPSPTHAMTDWIGWGLHTRITVDHMSNDWGPGRKAYVDEHF